MTLQVFGMAAGIVAPQNKRAWFVRQKLQHLRYQLLPTKFAVPARLPRGNSQYIVEQKHALCCPKPQIAIWWYVSYISVQFLEDVVQRPRQWGHVFSDRKRQSVGVPRRWVRILTEDHDFHRFRRTGVKCRKDLVPGREDFTLFGVKLF